MGVAERGAGRRVPLERWGLAAVCAGYVGWVLSLPAFPTQDGPVHLYFAHVLAALFGHGPGLYARFYTIKHVLPPYSAYYYLLIVLSRVMPLPLADKLVVCGYMVAFAYGFRYLARAVGPAGEQASLLATLLLLNWPLGMGFVNFCLGLALGLWTLGVWVRTVGRPGWGRKALFAGMCAGLVLVHPVPLLAVLGYCVVDLGVRVLRRETVTLADVGGLGLALLTLGYVKLFTIAHLAEQMLPSTEPVGRRLLRDCLMYARGQRLSFFSELFRHASGPVRVYHVLLLGMVPVGLGMAAWQARRAGGRGSVWLWLTVAMAAVLPFVPHDVNASHYFADRLPVFVWIGALLAMSGSQAVGRGARVAVAASVVAGTVAVLWAADGALRPIASEMARIETRPVEHVGEVGILLGDWSAPPVLPNGLTFNPYLWAGVHAFRRNDAVLYNTPWLDLTVIPLGARRGLATGVLPPNAVEDVPLTRLALGDAEMRVRVLDGIGFAVENHFDRPGVAGVDPLLEGWRCGVRADWYEMCLPGGGLR